MIALVMIATPRVWVKNKKSWLVKNGKLVPGFKLYFASGGRILVVPDSSLHSYAYVPARDPANILTCDRSDFKYLKLLAWGTTRRCAPLPATAEEATPLKLVFTADDGTRYEVSWEADPRR